MSVLWIMKPRCQIFGRPWFLNFYPSDLSITLSTTVKGQYLYPGPEDREHMRRQSYMFRRKSIPVQQLYRLLNSESVSFQVSTQKKCTALK